MFDKFGGVTRRNFVKGGLAAGALTALAACGGNGGETTEGGEGAAPAVTENYFSYYLSEPAYIDPYNGQENQGMAVIFACFDGLLVWDYDTNEPVPLAAHRL